MSKRRFTLLRAVAGHGPSESPCAMCALIAFTLTVIVLPLWQIVTFLPYW